jgi:transmembrane sensor
VYVKAIKLNTQDYIQNLLRKYIDNSINREEYDELIRFFGSLSQDQERFSTILETFLTDTEHVDQEALWNTLEKVDYAMEKRIFSEAVSAFSPPAVPKSIEMIPPKISWSKKLVPYAAAALLMMGIFSYYFFHFPIRKSTAVVAEEDTNFIPRSEHVLLTLADGSTVELSEAQMGIIMDDSTISYQNGTSIATYNPSSQNLVLKTPRGRQFQVTLPDGTKVRLNAASILRYPSRFTGDSREVEIHGEAYFQVVHNQMKPFIVKSEQQQVHVLGTSFNVSAYEGETMATTLLEGSVKVRLEHTKIQDILLIPGQQVRVHNNIPIIKQVHIEDYVAWTKGLFVFNDLPMQQMTEQLERWYDVEFIYPEKFIEGNYYAEIPRDRKLTEVLRYLERSGNLKFEQKGRRVYIKH